MADTNWSLISSIPFFYSDLSLTFSNLYFILIKHYLWFEALTLGKSLWNQKLKTKFFLFASVSSFIIILFEIRQLIGLIPFYCHLLLLITSAIFWYYKYSSWPWVLWVWWGGYGSGCDPIWCCALYCDLGIFFFVCVVVDLKPTVSSTEPVRKLEGKQRLKTRWLSVDGSWHTPTPDEIGLSHGLTLNPSPTDPWIPLYTF